MTAWSRAVPDSHSARAEQEWGRLKLSQIEIQGGAAPIGYRPHGERPPGGEGELRHTARGHGNHRTIIDECVVKKELHGALERMAGGVGRAHPQLHLAVAALIHRRNVCAELTRAIDAATTKYALPGIIWSGARLIRTSDWGRGGRGRHIRMQAGL